jgi:hypothetical protein
MSDAEYFFVFHASTASTDAEKRAHREDMATK